MNVLEQILERLERIERKLDRPEPVVSVKHEAAQVRAQGRSISDYLKERQANER